MAAKKRKDSIYIVCEGHEDSYFLEHLEKYSNVRLNMDPNRGGNANQIVIISLKHSDRNVNVYVIFDEDFETKPEQKISDETLEGLARAWELDKDNLKRCPYNQLQTLNTKKRNPILLVSHPQSIEGFLLRLLDSPKNSRVNGKTTKQLKLLIGSILGGIQLQGEDVSKIKSYEEKIAQYREELAKQKQSEPNYRERRRSLESKKADYERLKNKVTFMRFLSDKLPLPVMVAKRDDIPEIDILLKAFGL
jgi:5S rRNA maturation endonuclease (ribonuclease M5)